MQWLILFSCWQCKKLVLQYIPLVLVNGEKFLEKNDVCALLQACPASQKKTFSSVLQGALLSDAWIEGWRRTREAVRPRSLVLNLACSACFFSWNNIFLSQQFSRNSIFQSVSTKFQTSERATTNMLLPIACECFTSSYLHISIFRLYQLCNMLELNWGRHQSCWSDCPCWQSQRVFSSTSNFQKVLQYVSYRMFAARAWSIKCRRKKTNCTVWWKIMRRTFWA